MIWGGGGVEKNERKKNESHSPGKKISKAILQEKKFPKCLAEEKEI